jgi:FMN phosphatase YigB (HAD superfamily)
MIALDFDGVIADGIKECLLVSWAAFHGLQENEFHDNTLAQIPTDFIKRFRFLRNFVRHDGHFLVPFLKSASKIHNQNEFTSIYEKSTILEREAFRHRFVNYRNNVRKKYRDYWMELHTVYDPVIQLLACSKNIRIVSGKDTTSIATLLSFKGIDLPVEYIHGRITNKKGILQKLAIEAQGNLIFCDDNIMNVLEATRLGIVSIWALWGYHTDEHERLAHENGIFGTDIDQFLSSLSGHLS